MRDMPVHSSSLMKNYHKNEYKYQGYHDDSYQIICTCFTSSKREGYKGY